MTTTTDTPRNACPHCYSATMHGRNLCGTENENRTIECYLWQKLQKAEAEVERLTELLSLEERQHEETRQLCAKILDSTRKTPSLEWHRKNNKVLLK